MMQEQHTWFNFIQQRDVAISALIVGLGDVCNYVKILDMRYLLVQRRKLMEVGGKETECMNFGCDVSRYMVGHTVSDGKEGPNLL